MDENRLALISGDEVVEYSLDSRKEIHRHSFNKTILAAIYTKYALMISTQDTLLILDVDGKDI